MVRFWSNLSPEILDLILGRLGFPDCLTFGKVCSSWRSIFLDRRRVTRPPPCMVLAPYRESKDTVRLCGLHGGRLLKLNSPKPDIHPGVLILGSSLDWLAILGDGNLVHLLNPLSNNRIVLPRFRGRLTKTIYSVAMSTAPESGDCVVVLSGCVNDISICFAWCRPSDSEWTFLDAGFRLSTGDRGGQMSFHNGKLYLLTVKGFRVFDFNPEPKMIGNGSFAGISESKDWSRKQMVQLGTQLFLVGWRTHSGHRVLLDVFKQTEKTGWWVRAESLGDWVILIGSNIGITTQAFYPQNLMGSGFEPNCIYRIRIDEVEKFSVVDGSTEIIPVPLTESSYFRAEWIVPQTWDISATSQTTKRTKKISENLSVHRSQQSGIPMDREELGQH